MYGWAGPGFEALKKLHPSIVEASVHGNQGYGSIQHGFSYLANFSGDCGTLTMHGCGYADEHTLACFKDIASRTGHSKIIGTIVIAGETAYKDKVNLYEDAGFTVIQLGKSNRNPNKFDALVYYHNPNCIHKGY